MKFPEKSEIAKKRGGNTRTTESRPFRVGSAGSRSKQERSGLPEADQDKSVAQRAFIQALKAY